MTAVQPKTGGSMTSERLERAKGYLSIAESANAKYEAYKAAAEEIATHIEETGDQQKVVASKLQLTSLKAAEVKVGALLRWRRAGYPEGTTPFTMPDPGGSKPTDRAALSHARTVLRSPEERKRALSDLSGAELEAIASDVTEVAVDRLRAKRAEHDPTERGPTAGEIHDPSDPYDPAASWCDREIISATSRIRDLAAKVRREGLKLGALSLHEALDHLSEIELTVADLRAELQERLNDEKVEAVR